MKNIPFAKLEGCGNDYIFVDERRYPLDSVDLKDLAVRCSDRHLGIGADGLITIGESAVADVRMRIFNADGSEAEMCGNGIRGVAKLVYEGSVDEGEIKKKELSIETLAGIEHVTCNVIEGKVSTVRVNMGEPHTEAASIPVLVDRLSRSVKPDSTGSIDRLSQSSKPDSTGSIDRLSQSVKTASSAGTVDRLSQSVNGTSTDTAYIARSLELIDRVWTATCVSMGNPHLVLLVEPDEDLSALNISRYGAVAERLSIFPNRINVMFAQPLDEEHINLRIWERGSGITLGCGTGSCATLVAMCLTGHTGREADITQPGGTLHIEWSSIDNCVYMTGPTAEICRGEYLYG